MKKIAAVFPGQASQYVGMGKDFMNKAEGCRDILAAGEKITGLPLIEKIMEGPIEELTRTLICQPAVFAVNLICWHAYSSSRMSIHCAAGHSLGEYSALAAAKVFTVEEGFYIVRRRAEIMDSIAGQVDGGMLAVLGLKPEDVERLLAAHFPQIEIANVNSFSQVVVGGKNIDIRELNAFLKARKLRSVLLNVSGPFHTSLMEKAGAMLESELEKITIRKPEFPVYLNVSGKSTLDTGEIREGLLRQVCSPVRWLDTVNNMLADGLEAFVEFGPKKILKKIIEGVVPSEIKVLNVEDTDSLQDVLNYFYPASFDGL